MPLLLDAFNLPPAQAIDYLRRKGMAISWHWTDTWREAHAKAFTVAKVTSMDVLQDLHGLVTSAVADGQTFQQFKKGARAALAKRGWLEEVEIGGPDGQTVVNKLGSTRRLRTIYSTNVQTAYQAGRYKQQQEVVKARPYWQYVSVVDEQTTARCRQLDGKVMAADDPFWTNLYPPNHWGCRARVRTLSPAALQREGLSVSPPGTVVEKEMPVGPRKDTKWVNVKGYKTTTGDGQPFTYWPDPGWDYNPGREAWEPDLSKYDPDLVEQYKKSTK